jgi:hypothetical protein
MSVQEKGTKVELEFAGEAFADGRVPLTVVAAKLQALQTLIYHAAAAIAGDQGTRRGQWFNKYRESAELAFESAHHSNLQITASLASNAYLFDDFNDGAKAVDLVFQFGRTLESSATSADQLSKDDRRYLRRAFEGLMPNTTDDYKVTLRNGSATHPPLTLTPELRRKMKNAAAQPIGSLSEVTLAGELIEIHIDTGSDKVRVRTGSREIDCYYPDSLRDQIANLCGGSFVEVSGYATLNENNEILKLNEVLDVQTASLDPLRMRRFEHNGRRYDLNQPVVVQITYDDGLWEYSNDALNIRGYADRRDDALRELHACFDFAYRDIAEANDAELSAGALKLKQRLLDIVLTTQKGD